MNKARRPKKNEISKNRKSDEREGEIKSESERKEEHKKRRTSK